ncbi:MAG: queuosine precursor transporter [Anaerolineae bacterium]|nr:queuosine precursor transporter [Anaerolineae bacterium]
MQEKQTSWPISGLLVVSAYIAAQMMADVASLKIALVGPAGAALPIDGGTFIYPFTFTLRDLVHKLLGKAAARTLIITAAAINLIMAALFAFVAWLPADPSWGLQAEFAAILGPVWRIVLASIVAEVVSELLDTEMYELWVTRVTSKLRFARYQWTRVLVSNAVSVPVDSVIFCWIAFWGLPAGVVWGIVLSNILVKGVVTLLSLPGIYLVRET